MASLFAAVRMSPIGVKRTSIGAAKTGFTSESRRTLNLLSPIESGKPSWGWRGRCHVYHRGGLLSGVRPRTCWIRFTVCVGSRSGTFIWRLAPHHQRLIDDRAR